MIKIRKSAERGQADHGWLDARHTFSFAGYHDPDHMGFGPLRVLNQDRIAAHQGFPTHGHADMEIVTYVLEGELEHQDSMGNGSRIRAGEVQLMSAGTGVQHSEFNVADGPLHLLQMWVHPRDEGTVPRYEQRLFSEAERRGQLRLVVSPDGAAGSLTIAQDALLYAGLLAPGDRATHPIGPDRRAWVHVARGVISLNGHRLEPGDGAAVENESSVHVEGIDDAEVLLWDLAGG